MARGQREPRAMLRPRDVSASSAATTWEGDGDIEKVESEVVTPESGKEVREVVEWEGKGGALYTPGIRHENPWRVKTEAIEDAAQL
jgi:hypothetical protein